MFVYAGEKKGEKMCFQFFCRAIHKTLCRTRGTGKINAVCCDSNRVKLHKLDLQRVVMGCDICCWSAVRHKELQRWREERVACSHIDKGEKKKRERRAVVPQCCS